MWLMTVFGVSALLLAAIGIYGLMAYSVEQRTQEIGIRLALGAQAVAGQEHGGPAGDASRARRGGHRGWCVALPGAADFRAPVRRQRPDPLVFVGVPVLLTVVALLAVWFPARRASRVDPMVALRYE